MIKLYADMIMCLLWITTYLLIFVSTYKNDKPAMHPMSCAVIFPWEFAMLCENVINQTFFNYAFIGYVGWAIIDLGIIRLIIYKIKWYETKKRKIYLLFVFLLSILMTYIFTMPNGTLYTSYINTIVGVFIWILYTAKIEYPRTRLNFIILVVKLIADSLGWIKYHEHDNIVMVLSTLLPVLDLLHIYAFRKTGKIYA